MGGWTVSELKGCAAAVVDYTNRGSNFGNWRLIFSGVINIESQKNQILVG